MTSFLAFLDQLWIARLVILKGLGVTVSISLLAILVGSLLGVFVGLALVYGNRALRFLVRAYTDFIRGTPVLVLVLASYYVLSTVGIELGPFQAGVLALAVFCSSHVGEIVRGGLQAIPKGQYEGAKALGLGYWQMMRLIILPQALKLVIPGIVNTFIGLFKDTTLVLIVGMFDLLGQIQSSFTDPTWATPVTSRTGYLFAAVIFFAFCFGMSRYSIYMERRLNTGHKR